MKTIYALKLLSLLCFGLLSSHVEARKGVSLNEAVNQVKSEGRVLSAKTIDGKHEIKILTPNGTVKTINKKAAKQQVKVKPPRPDYYNRGGRSMRDRKQNPAIPRRFDSQRNTAKINPNQQNTRTLDLQPMTQDRNSRGRSTKKEKDK